MSPVALFLYVFAVVVTEVHFGVAVACVILAFLLEVARLGQATSE